MKTCFLASLLLILGCAGPSTVKVNIQRSYPSGIEERITASLKGPEYALGGSTLEATTNGVIGSLSASQDIKGIEKAKGESASALEKVKGANSGVKIIYVGLALIGVLSVAALFLPAKIVSNKDALLGFALAGAGFVVVRYVEASAPVMKWVIPAVALGCGVYLFVLWRKGRVVKRKTKA